MPDGKRFVSNRISLLLFSVMALLVMLDIFTGYFLKNLTNLHKIIIYIVIFVIPMIIYLKKNRYRAGTALKLKHFKMRYLPFVLMFGISVSVICTVINTVFGVMLSGLNVPLGGTSTVSFSSDNMLVMVIANVLMPAVCEELLIRGLALGEYEKYGVAVSVIMTSAVFSLFHGSLLNIPSLFIAGVCYAVITHLFKSVYPAMLCHIINNSIAVYTAQNSDFLSYLAEDMLFVIIVIAVIFIILYITLRLTENVIDELGDKKRLKTNTRKLVYGDPLTSPYIWLFAALSIFTIVRNLL